MLVHACGQRTAYAIQRSVAADGNQENEDYVHCLIQLGLQGLELDDLRSSPCERSRPRATPYQ